LVNFKWLSAIIIFIGTLIGNVLPLFITAKKWTSRLETMAGGVFLGAGLAHLLDDSYEELEEVKNLKYPLAPAVALATFVILTAVELFSYSESDANAFGDNDNDSYKAISEKSLINENLAGGNNKDFLSEPIIPDGQNITTFGNSMKNMTAATISLYVIMDIHSTIEGLALGIMKKYANTVAIFIAIIGHKPVEAFALSLILLKDKPTKFWFWIMVVIYSLLSPIGIIIAIYITRSDNPLTLGLIAAFSAGTFLFVGCHEWSEMFEHKNEWTCQEKLWHFSSSWIF